MITFGIAKSVETRKDGTVWVKTRIPSVHGADSQSAYAGQIIRNYTPDDRLPWYQSILLPKNPSSGDILALLSINNANNDFLVIGITKGGGEK